MESFEKRQRERKKQEIRKEKAARKLQGLEAAGPSQADYFADLNPTKPTPVPDEVDTESGKSQAATDPSHPKGAKSPPAAQSGGGEIGAR